MGVESMSRTCEVEQMKKLTVVLMGVMALAGVSACGGGDGGGGSGEDAGVFFALDDADALAHDALPVPSDLEADWEVTNRDQFDDSSDDADFEALMASESACSTMSALAGMGGFFGDSGEEVPAGRANVEMTSMSPDALVPSQAEFEVEIEETVAEVQGGWKLVRELMGSDDFDQCMLAVMTKAFAAEDMPEGASVDITSRNPSSQAPNNGVTMAYDINMDLGAIQLDMALELYMWPYGNAKVMALFVGDQDALSADLTDSALATFEQKLSDAAS